MGILINLKSYVEPETTLFQQAVDFILAIIDQVLDSFDTHPTQGTFILDGQAYGEKAKCILRFNLEDGVLQPLEGFEDTSDDIAAGAINKVLAWPETPAYGYKAEPNFFGRLPSGVYKQGRNKVLVLNTTFGRFLMSYYANSGCSMEAHDEGSALLLAVAETIAQMGKEDKVLQRSAYTLGEQSTGVEKDAVILVKRLFLEDKFPPLLAWKKWHEPANTSGKLTLFFE